MPIQEQNIVFVESQIMDDVPEGGGAATGQVVPDGVMNNVFEDISDLDRAYGRFNLRKLFLAVRSLDTALYGGAKIVLTETPTDPALSYTLFTTEDPFDTRAEAADAVAAYLYKGPSWHGVLYEDHITGMRAISILQRLNTQLPIVGQTLCLVQDEGLVTEKEQYLRVITVSAVETTFADADSDYVRWVVRLGLSDTLRHNFNGHTPSRTDNYTYTNKARLRATTVADAMRYCSSQPLTDPAAIGASTVNVASVFAQLIPSTQTETPLVSQVLNPDVVQVLTAGTRTVEVAQQAHTRAIAVTVESRRYNWIETLTPRPASATLSVAYRSQGNWYTLRDSDGAGTLTGSDVAFGSGTVNYTTGDAAVTLGALPDADTLILYAWASPAHYSVRAGGTALNEAFVVVPFTLTKLPVLPATVALAWEAGGVAKTATANAAGVISGDGSGTIDPITGGGELRLTQLPDRGSSLAISYDWYKPTNPADEAVVTETHLLASPITLNAIPQDQTVRFWVTLGNGELALKILATNNGGTIEMPPQFLSYINPAIISLPPRMWTESVQSIGTISGAAITLNATLDVTYLTYEVDEEGHWVETPRTLTINGTAETEVTYRPGSIAGSAESATQAQDIDALTLRLLPTVTDSAVINSLRFALGGVSYDDANGALLIPAQGNLVAGTVDYATGDVTLTYWAGGATAAPSVSSLLSRYGQWTAIEASFRTVTGALKSQSLSLVAVTDDGVQITGSADADGVISGDWMRGSCVYETGTATVEFGQMAGNPLAWTPRSVDPGTIRYNAVAYSYVPLDADILGIDAVRLPSDGRVPIYRAGDVVQILHAATTTGTPAQSGGAGPYVLSCERTRLAFAKVTDANGAAVTDGYTLDRAAGTLSWDTLDGLATPLTVKHTIGDLRLVTDVRIDGALMLARPLSHDFPAAESLVAACLIFGDRRARVAAVWDQSSWDNVWTDSLTGSAAAATLNTIDYPITVTNEGCDTDRWLLRWTSTTAVELLSEKRGLVWSGSYPAYVSGDPVDIAPINPRTRDENGQNGVPYLTIPQRANGGGWSAGNVVRINTVGAIADFWIARSIQQSEEPAGDGADGCEIYALGNIDRP